MKDPVQTAIVLAGGMPFINEAVIRYITSNARGYDVVVPKIDGLHHPLIGIYSRKCISVIERLMKEDRLNVAGIFPEVRTLYIDGDQLKKINGALKCLANINTRENYEACLSGR